MSTAIPPRRIRPRFRYLRGQKWFLLSKTQSRTLQTSTQFSQITLLYLGHEYLNIWETKRDGARLCSSHRNGDLPGRFNSRRIINQNSIIYQSLSKKIWRAEPSATESSTLCNC